MADGGLTPDVPVEALTQQLARGKRTTINPRRVSRESLEAGRLQYPDVGQHADRPRTRGECEHDVLPCPWVSCKHHLFLDVDERTGSIKLNFPGKEVWELRETCALRVADRDGETLEEIAELMHLTRERVRQLELRALAAAHTEAVRLGVDGREPEPVAEAEPEPDVVRLEQALGLAGWRRASGRPRSPWRSPQGVLVSWTEARLEALSLLGEEPERQLTGRGYRKALGLPPASAARAAVLAEIRAADTPSVGEIARRHGVTPSLATKWSAAEGIDLVARLQRRKAAARR